MLFSVSIFLGKSIIKRRKEKNIRKVFPLTLFFCSGNDQILSCAIRLQGVCVCVCVGERETSEEWEESGVEGAIAVGFAPQKPKLKARNVPRAGYKFRKTNTNTYSNTNVYMQAF